MSDINNHVTESFSAREPSEEVLELHQTKFSVNSQINASAANVSTDEEIVELAQIDDDLTNQDDSVTPQNQRSSNYMTFALRETNPLVHQQPSMEEQRPLTVEGDSGSTDERYGRPESNSRLMRTINEERTNRQYDHFLDYVSPPLLIAVHGGPERQLPVLRSSLTTRNGFLASLSAKKAAEAATKQNPYSVAASVRRIGGSADETEAELRRLCALSSTDLQNVMGRGGREVREWYRVLVDETPRGTREELYRVLLSEAAGTNISGSVINDLNGAVEASPDLSVLPHLQHFVTNNGQCAPAMLTHFAAPQVKSFVEQTIKNAARRGSWYGPHSADHSGRTASASASGACSLPTVPAGQLTPSAGLALRIINNILASRRHIRELLNSGCIQMSSYSGVIDAQASDPDELSGDDVRGATEAVWNAPFDELKYMLAQDDMRQVRGLWLGRYLMSTQVSYAPCFQSERIPSTSQTPQLQQQRTQLVKGVISMKLEAVRLFRLLLIVFDVHPADFLCMPKRYVAVGHQTGDERETGSDYLTMMMVNNHMRRIINEDILTVDFLYRFQNTKINALKCRTQFQPNEMTRRRSHSSEPSPSRSLQASNDGIQPLTVLPESDHQRQGELMLTAQFRDWEVARQTAEARRNRMHTMLQEAATSRQSRPRANTSLAQSRDHARPHTLGHRSALSRFFSELFGFSSAFCTSNQQSNLSDRNERFPALRQRHPNNGSAPPSVLSELQLLPLKPSHAPLSPINPVLFFGRGNSSVEICDMVNVSNESTFHFENLQSPATVTRFAAQFGYGCEVKAHNDGSGEEGSRNGSEEKLTYLRYPVYIFSETHQTKDENEVMHFDKRISSDDEALKKHLRLSFSSRASSPVCLGTENDRCTDFFGRNHYPKNDGADDNSVRIFQQLIVSPRQQSKAATSEEDSQHCTVCGVRNVQHQNEPCNHHSIDDTLIDSALLSPNNNNHIRNIQNMRDTVPLCMRCNADQQETSNNQGQQTLSFHPSQKLEGNTTAVSSKNPHSSIPSQIGDEIHLGCESLLLSSSAVQCSDTLAAESPLLQPSSSDKSSTEANVTRTRAFEKFNRDEVPSTSLDALSPRSMEIFSPTTETNKLSSIRRINHCDTTDSALDSVLISPKAEEKKTSIDHKGREIL